jgi:hypothetical protein
VFRFILHCFLRDAYLQCTLHHLYLVYAINTDSFQLVVVRG